MNRQLTSINVRSLNQLFLKRVRSQWLHQISVLRSVADWVIMLYILIPALLIGGGLYMELWSAPLPEWVGMLPQQTAALALLFFYSGSILLFTEEADVLFLRQNERWMRGLRLRGMLYSFAVTVLRAVLLTAVILPFLVRGFELHTMDLIGWSILAAGTGWFFSLAARRVKVRYKGLRESLFTAALRIGSILPVIILFTQFREQPAVAAAAGLLLIALSWLPMKSVLRARGTFNEDARLDARVRLWLTDKLVTRAAGAPPKVRSRVFLFRRSRRIFRSAEVYKRFAGAFIKQFFRQPESVWLYVQFSTTAIFAVVFPPGIVKMIVYTALMFMLSYMLYAKWKSFADAEFSMVLPFTMEQQYKAGILAVRIVMVPPSVILSLVFGLTIWPGWAGAGIGLFLSWMLPSAIPSLVVRPGNRNN